MESRENIRESDNRELFWYLALRGFAIAFVSNSIPKRKKITSLWVNIEQENHESPDNEWLKKSRSFRIQ